MNNPYLDAVSAPVSETECKQSRFMRDFLRREILTSRYAWAIPTEHVVRRLAQLSPICDMGCGTGYWAWLLRQAGAEVLPVDPHPVGCINHWHKDPQVEAFVEITHADASSFVVPASHTLMLCWPPYGEPMAMDALRGYRGQHVVYIGELGGGCTADDAFHSELATKWHFVEELPIPQWWGVHDSVYIYRRTAA